jgi:hypothetical protein
MLTAHWFCDLGVPGALTQITLGRFVGEALRMATVLPGPRETGRQEGDCIIASLVDGGWDWLGFIE